MWVCRVMVNPPVPTVIETGLGTSCGAAAGAAEAPGGEEMATRYPTATTKRERIGRGLRRRLGKAVLSAPSSGKRHRYPEAVRFLPMSVYTRVRSDDKSGTP